MTTTFPTPLPAPLGLLASYPCGCQVRADVGDGGTIYAIHAYRLHNAAGAYRDALQEIAEGLQDATWCVLKARAALAAAQPIATERRRTLR